MLATNFGSLCPEVTNFGSQNFGYQIWFCIRLLFEHINGLVQDCDIYYSPLSVEIPQSSVKPLIHYDKTYTYG